MQFIEEKIIKKACYVLRRIGSAYVYINSSSLLIETEQGIRKKYPIPNPSHFCFCGNSSMIALLNTAGQLFIINTQADIITPIPISNSCEGCAPVFFQNNVYWGDWGGKIFKYNLFEQKVEVIVDLSEQNIMIVNLDIDDNRNQIVATLYSKKDSCYYLLCKHISINCFMQLELPIKKQGVIVGANCHEDKFILYESKSNLIYIFELSQDKLNVFKTISIPRKYGLFDCSLCVCGELLAIQNRNYVVVIDINKEKIVFELLEKYINSVNFSKDRLYIGCWDKGFSFLIKNNELVEQSREK